MSRLYSVKQLACRGLAGVCAVLLHVTCNCGRWITLSPFWRHSDKHKCVFNLCLTLGTVQGMLRVKNMPPFYALRVQYTTVTLKCDAPASLRCFVAKSCPRRLRSTLRWEPYRGCLGRKWHRTFTLGESYILLPLRQNHRFFPSIAKFFYLNFCIFQDSQVVFHVCFH